MEFDFTGTNNDESTSYDSSYKVNLDKFQGPLDLLLYLIKKNELDIYDIPIALITRQYLEYIKALKDLNLEIAGDFLVMASTLIQIKSSMLLPSRNDDNPDEEAEDPRAELIRRLVEYSRYKEAALKLNQQKLLGRELFARSTISEELISDEAPTEPLELDLFALIEAFRVILAKAPRESFHEVCAESISIAERINEILSLLQENEFIAFIDLFEKGRDKDYIVATFLAILELCKLKLIRVRQQKQYGDIWIWPAVLDDTDNCDQENIDDSLSN
ncbi:MAG: segregation/condensation protein A [Deltaproteobacteria bacterium]|nr:segregation/condensation protein A [Deltaproteobacteria bacterium]TLN03793.1 MAG: segregation/condensation protein A [bacterium]